MDRTLFDYDCAARLFLALGEHWRDSAGYKGIYRPGYSMEETAAVARVIGEASRIGMQCFSDLAGNVYMILRGANPHAQVIITGSHLDCVPQGGQYDGPAGVVGPLAMCSALVKAQITLPQDLVVMIIRAEESPWFAQGSIGSRLATGQFDTAKFESLSHREDGKSLSGHMEACGVDTRKLARGKPLIPLSCVAAFIELHIEQGPVLHQKHMPVGVVTSNRGSVRIAQVRLRGEGGHTGAVPMELRKDAVRAAAQFIARFEASCNALIADGHDLVYTIPVISTGPQASPTTIPPECSFYLEARSESEATQAAILTLLDQIKTSVELDYRVEISMDAPVINKPASMDADIQAQLTGAAKKAGIDTMAMAAGASHDAAIFTHAGVPSGMLFVRHEGHSHRHDETMELEDLAACTQVLARFCIEAKSAHAQPFGEALEALGAERIMTQEYDETLAHG